jgi:hypothetical protein
MDYSYTAQEYKTACQKTINKKEMKYQNSEAICTSKLFYNFLRNKKFQKPCAQSK